MAGGKGKIHEHPNAGKNDFSKRPEQAGRPVGARNRSTIAKKILELKSILSSEAFEKLIQLFPDITQGMTTEEIATLVQAHKAIVEGDTAAYRSLLDSAYGSPQQQLDHTNNGGKFDDIPPINISIDSKDIELK